MSQGNEDLKYKFWGSILQSLITTIGAVLVAAIPVLGYIYLENIKNKPSDHIIEPTTVNPEDSIKVIKDTSPGKGKVTKDLKTLRPENLPDKTEQKAKETASDALKILHTDIKHLGACENPLEMKLEYINTISSNFRTDAEMEVSCVQGDNVSIERMPIKTYFIRLAYLCIVKYREVNFDFPYISTSRAIKKSEHVYVIKGEFLQKFTGIFKVEDKNKNISTYSDLTLKITDIEVNTLNGDYHFGNTIVMHTQKIE